MIDFDSSLVTFKLEVIVFNILSKCHIMAVVVNRLVPYVIPLIMFSSFSPMRKYKRHGTLLEESLAQIQRSNKNESSLNHS